MVYFKLIFYSNFIAIQNNFKAISPFLAKLTSYSKAIPEKNKRNLETIFYTCYQSCNNIIVFHDFI